MYRDICLDEKKGKKRLQIAVILLVTVILTGCGNAGKKQIESQEPDNSPEMEIETDRKLWQEDMKSCLILEDEDNIYVCGLYKLLKINKISRDEQVLWENTGFVYMQPEYLYSRGSGLLFHDKIYFIEAWVEDDGETESKALTVISTDGSGYQRIKQISGDGDMLVMDGMLYVDDHDVPLCYEVYEDGTLSEMKNTRDMEGYQSVPEGYVQKIYYFDNKYRVLLPAQQLKDLGYLILRNEDYDLVKIDPETGEETKLTDKIGSFEAYNDQYFLTNSINNESWELYLVNKETMEKRFLAGFEDNRPHIITMDEEYVYLVVEDIDEGETQYIYEKIFLQTGELSVIFKDDPEEKVADYTSTGFMDPVLKNGYLYYAGTKDYKLYLMRRSLEDPSKEEILGDAFYDSGISQVGTIESYHKKIYSESNPDIMLTQTDLEWLKVDERFKGAQEINRCLEAYQKNHIAYEEDNAQWLEEDAQEYGEYVVCYSYSSVVSEIAFFDEKYLSFCQKDYDYTGGAHGMPLWIGFTFDLETGQRLGLKDIIGNSEEELKEIVTEYFAEYIGKNPDNFWDDAVDYVREHTTLTSDFYLTEEGIVFYYEPYALAPYAGGFQVVTIPYEEFEMKIQFVY